MSELARAASISRTDLRARALACVELTKPRIAALVLVATATGFVLGVPAGAGLERALALVHTLLGTALVAAGANALNQLMEAEYDARMSRTCTRPLPSGRLGPLEVLTFGCVTGSVGIAYLFAYVEPLAALLAAATLTCYVLVYTPLKRLTPLSVFVGAVPGALPPVIGWAAASGAVGFEAVLLFLIVALWQLPHFASIAWLYRDDYARAGFPVLSVVDRDGARTDLHLVSHSIALLVASLLPALHGLRGPIYAGGAMLFGVAFLGCGVLFVSRKSRALARLHVLASVVYLPCLLGLMLVERVVIG